jgi:hypothetical protein
METKKDYLKVEVEVQKSELLSILGISKYTDIYLQHAAKVLIEDLVDRYFCSDFFDVEELDGFIGPIGKRVKFKLDDIQDVKGIVVGENSEISMLFVEVPSEYFGCRFRETHFWLKADEVEFID